MKIARVVAFTCTLWGLAASLFSLRFADRHDTFQLMVPSMAVGAISLVVWAILGAFE